MAPSTPKRTLIRNALVAALQGIAADAVYHTDLGDHVDAWRALKSKPWQGSELPACNVRDMFAQVLLEQTGGSKNFWHNRLTVEIDIGCNDIDTFTNCVADIFTAIDVDPTLGGIAIDTNAVGYSPDVDQEEKIVVGGLLTLTVDYSTDRLAA